MHLGQGDLDGLIQRSRRRGVDRSRRLGFALHGLPLDDGFQIDRDSNHGSGHRITRRVGFGRAQCQPGNAAVSGQPAQELPLGGRHQARQQVELQVLQGFFIVVIPALHRAYHVEAAMEANAGVEMLRRLLLGRLNDDQPESTRVPASVR